jgi:hypothetical protein
LKSSVKDACRRKCTFCLGFFSVFIVVWISLVINTIIDKGPVIFLRLAEGTSGEIDGIITSNTLNTDEKEYVDFLNFTQI